MNDLNTRFSKRRKILTVRQDAMQVAAEIRNLLGPNSESVLRTLLDELHPADLADAMLFLTAKEEKVVFNLLDYAEAAEVLDEVDATTEANLVQGVSAERLARILEEIPSDEGANVLGEIGKDQAEQVLSLMQAKPAQEIRTLLAYPKHSAGGIMSLGFVDVPETATQAEALQRFQAKSQGRLGRLYPCSLSGRALIRLSRQAPLKPPFKMSSASVSSSV